jgi:hypothetical protein
VAQTQEELRIHVGVLDVKANKSENCCTCYETENLILPCGHRMCFVCLVKLKRSKCVKFICAICRGTLDKAYTIDLVGDYTKTQDKLTAYIGESM